MSDPLFVDKVRDIVGLLPTQPSPSPLRRVKVFGFGHATRKKTRSVGNGAGELAKSHKPDFY
jgi:hypothetical protein